MQKHNPNDKHPDDEDFVDRCSYKNCRKGGIWKIGKQAYCDRHFDLLKRNAENDSPTKPLRPATGEAG